jgi:chromosomal replication initiation ATPase DnaA
MRIAYAGKTMAGAKRLIQEDKPTPRRDKLIEASLKWRADKLRRDSAITVEIERLRLQALIDDANLRHRTTPAITIVEMVAAWHDFPVHEILSTNKPAPLVEARFDAIAAVWLNCSIAGRKMSLKEIGRVFGGRDHTTILHALRMRGL